MYVCLCNAITESKVKQAGQAGIVTARALIEHFGLENEECCGYCLKHIDFFVDIAEGDEALNYVRYHAEHPRLPGPGLEGDKHAG